MIGPKENESAVVPCYATLLHSQDLGLEFIFMSLPIVPITWATSASLSCLVVHRSDTEWHKTNQRLDAIHFCDLIMNTGILKCQGVQSLMKVSHA